jgi:hypothetical protein
MNMLLLKKKKYACKKLDNFADVIINPLTPKIWKTEMYQQINKITKYEKKNIFTIKLQIKQKNSFFTL